MPEGDHFVRHEPCPKCGSKDNLARYSSGSASCFTMGCGYYEKGEQKTEPNSESSGNPFVQAEGEEKRKSILKVEGEITSLPKRGIHEETCKHWGYRVGEYNGRPAQFAYYYDPDTRQPVACKVRFPNKDFTWLGNPKQAPLYGQWLCRDGGKMIVVTEGEIDALTMSQLQNLRWPVVSVQNGAQGADRSLKKAYDWLMKFDTIVLMFDQDEPGIAAAKKCAELFPPGKVKIAHLPCKDANECLQQGKGDKAIDAMWQAKTYRPDGIVSGMDLWDTISKDDVVSSVPYPWVGLNEKTHGIRLGELVTITAGSGIGKSAIVREIAYHLLNQGETVGMIMLEESVKRSAIGLMGLAMNRPLHLSRHGVTQEEMKQAFDATLGTGRVYLYDHFGSTDVDNLLSRVRYLAKALDCKWVILDHLSIVVSGLDDGGDERKLIDRAMTMLRTLVEETGIGLILVSHLKRPPGTGHEDGAQTSLSQLRGSAAIGQLSDMVLGLERNQQGENPNETKIRILKNRFSGETGEGATLYYDRDTGRLTEFKPVSADGSEASTETQEF